MIAVAEIIGCIYSLLRIFGKGNDDLEQLEYILELQDKKKKKDKNNLPECYLVLSRSQRAWCLWLCSKPWCKL